MSSSSIRLGVNIDHVATIRQLRLGFAPDPVEFALIAEKKGAHQITCHLREDRRHIQDQDLFRLRKAVRTLNVEVSLSQDIGDIVLAVRPDSVCVVPEKRAELTTEGGLDLRACCEKLERMLDSFRFQGIRVSLFIDPHPQQVALCSVLGVDAVEFHTGRYAEASNEEERRICLSELVSAAQQAHHAGLLVHAGHGLDYHNVSAVLSLPHLVELNIGYAIVVRSLAVGWGEAVSEMKWILEGL